MWAARLTKDNRRLESHSLPEPKFSVFVGCAAKLGRQGAKTPDQVYSGGRVTPDFAVTYLGAGRNYRHSERRASPERCRSTNGPSMFALGTLPVRQLIPKTTTMTFSSTGISYFRRSHVLLAWLAASSSLIVACASPSERTPLITDVDDTEGSDDPDSTRPSDDEDDDHDDDGSEPSGNYDTGADGLTDGDDPMDDGGGTSTSALDDSTTSGSTGDEPEDSLGGQIAVLRAQHSDLCVEVSGGATGDGVVLAQAECSGLDHQRWRFESVGPFYRVRSVGLGKCASVAGSDLGNEAQIQQWPCVDEPNQLWTIETDDDGSVRLIGVQSGRCMDVSDISHDVGAVVWQYDCHGGDNQAFYLE